MPDEQDEQVIVKCPGCGVPILSFWNNGLLRGEYVLIADTLWHPKCYEEWANEFDEATGTILASVTMENGLA